MQTRLVFLLCLFAAAATARADHHEEFVSLFNGENLDGWRNPYGHGEAWVENPGEEGVICMKADRKFFLVSEEQYSDFVFEGEIMLPAEGTSNSGICFRCRFDEEKNAVIGYQAECDPSERGWTGGLYDEGRRAWLYPRRSQAGKKKLFQAPLGEWIKYRIECHGNHIEIAINGKRTTHFHDNMDRKGYIAIQHHGEKDQVYRFRNLRIRELHGEHEESEEEKASAATASK